MRASTSAALYAEGISLVLVLGDSSVATFSSGKQNGPDRPADDGVVVPPAGSASAVPRSSRSRSSDHSLCALSGAPATLADDFAPTFLVRLAALWPDFSVQEGAALLLPVTALDFDLPIRAMCFDLDSRPPIPPIAG